MILTYYIPLFSMFQWETNAGRESWLFIWQMFPVWIMLAGILSSSIIPDTTASDRINAPQRDLPIIRYTMGTLVVVSSATWIWTHATSQYSFITLFTLERLPTQTTDFVSFSREFLKLDEISLLGHTFLWLGYLFWDMKSAGMMQTGWVMILLYFGATLAVLGPGATAGLGWLWRENILATRRHRHAIVSSSVSPEDVGQHEKNVNKEVE
jgi:hypothetical protein